MRFLAFLAALFISASAYAQAIHPGRVVGGVVGERPSLDLPFVDLGAIPYGVTFSRASVGTYRDATGTRQTASANQARFDHDSVGTPLGLLIESSRTNFLLNSASPATQTTGSLNTGTYTLWVEGSGSATMSAGTATGCGSSAATSGTPVIFTVTVSGTCTVTVAGTLTAFQLEDGANSTSFISTAGATVTRSADMVGVTMGGWFNPAEGTFRISGSIPHVPNASGVLPHMAQLNDGSSNIIAPGRYISNSILLRVGPTIGGTQTNIDPSPGAMTNGVVERVAYGYKAVSHAASRNGGALAINTVVGVPTGINAFVIGRNSASGDSQWWNGHIRRVTYWPKRLSDQSIQAISAR